MMSMVLGMIQKVGGGGGGSKGGRALWGREAGLEWQCGGCRQVEASEGGCKS